MDSGEGRLRCTGCGANNFPTQSSCWKCGVALDSRQAPVPRGGADVFQGSQVAAAVLGLVLPFVGFATGLIFLMLGGTERARMGKSAIAWAAAGAAAHVLGTMLLAGAIGRLMLAPLTRMIQSATTNTVDPGAKLPPGFE